MKDVFHFVKQIHVFSGTALYINLIAMILISLLDGVGILLLIPMISMSGIVQLDVGDSPLTMLFSIFENMPISVGLPVILTIYIFIAISQNFIHRHITIKNGFIQHTFYRHLRIETYRGLLYANWDFFMKKRKSDLVNIMTTEINKTGSGVYAFVQFLSATVFTFIQIGIAFWLSPNITIFVLLCGALLLLLNRKFLKRSLSLGERNYELGRSYLGGITDQINGIKDIKSNTLEASRMDWYHSITKKVQDQQVSYVKLKATSQLYYKIASTIFIALFIYLAVHLFNAQGGQLMLVVIIFSRLWPQVVGIQSSLEQLATAIPSFKAVRRVQEDSRKALEVQVLEGKASEHIRLDKELTCQSVFFRYNKDKAPFTLEDINIVIPANQMTAFVGKSGAGKSTLIDLLMGLNEPEKGLVLIDGKPLKNNNIVSLRNSISYVPQDPFLFNASIRDNLQLVAPNVSEKEMWEALQFASASVFVKELHKGLDSVIGDRGIKLSGGEQQRLVLARAILRNPSILILDEATSSLDTENEKRIQEALEGLRGKMTIIVIAHRLSTIRNADQVIVMDKGKVIQVGGFNQLSKEKKSTFNTLLQNQLGATQ